MMTLYFCRSGSSMVSLNSIPSVKYLILVFADDLSSNRIVYPTCKIATRIEWSVPRSAYVRRVDGGERGLTSSPSTVPISSATLAATLVAATLRG